MNSLSLPRSVGPAARGPGAPSPPAGAGQNDRSCVFATALSAADEQLVFDEGGETTAGMPGFAVQDSRDGAATAADDRTPQPVAVVGPQPGIGTASLAICTTDLGWLLAQNGLPVRPIDAQPVAGSSGVGESASRSTLAATAVTAATPAATMTAATAAGAAANAIDKPFPGTAECGIPLFTANAATAAATAATTPATTLATGGATAANAFRMSPMVDAAAQSDPLFAAGARGAIAPGLIQSPAPTQKAAQAFGNDTAASPASMRSIPAVANEPAWQQSPVPTKGETERSAVLPDPTDPARAASAAPQADARAGASAAAASTALLPVATAAAPVKAPPELLAALASEGSPRTDERRQSCDDANAAPAQATALHPGAALAAAPALAPAHAAAAEVANAYPASAERIVEQVSWWLSQKIQNADFKIDMPGGPPLSVSVQVKGNEAQVAFRSDQPEIRQWLGQALPLLKDSFGHEGLLLSGASIGAHAEGHGQRPGDAQQRHGRAPTDAVQPPELARSAAPAAASPAQRAPSGSARGSLDLYV